MADPDLSQFMKPTKVSGGDPDLSQFMTPNADIAAAVKTVDATRQPTVKEMLRPSRPPSVPGGRVGAFGRAADRELLPTGTAAMGAATGAEVGALGGPFDPVTIPVGALIGGGLGYWAGKKGQQSVMDNWVPQGALKAVGQAPEQVRADEMVHPVSTALGGITPSLIGGGALSRSMMSPEVADLAMMTGKTAPAAATTRDTINATRAAAQRQGVTLPTTLTSPTGYKVSRVLPKVFGGSAIETAEAAAPQAVGSKLKDLADTYLKPTDPGEVGAAVQDAAAKWAEKQRLTGGDLIESAGKQAAGIPLAPESTLGYIDKELARLEINPIANASQIKMLNGLKGDLTNKDNPLDLNSLHDLRTSLYRNAVPEGLSASAAAKTRGDLWTTLSDDIQTGLGKAADGGSTQAHDALTDFNAGSDVWKTRQSTIKSTLGKILGNDTDQTEQQVGDMTQPMFVASKSPEDAAAAITKMVGSDRRGVKTLLSTLDDDAKDTVRASVIGSLGRDAAGNFSAPIFLKQMHSIPDVTRDTLFGADHAAALDDLETIVKNVGQAKPRHGGLGAYGVELGIAGLLGLHGGYGEAGSAAAAMLGGNMAAAHLLSQPDNLKWLAKLSSAASNGNAAPVLGRLATAARSSPALASLYDNLQQAATDLNTRPPEAPKAKDAKSEGFDPSKMTDEELGPGDTPAAAPSDTNRVALINSMDPKEAMALTIAGEASSDPHEMAGVGHVMANRLASGKYGSTLADVLKPEEFNVWEDPAALMKLKGSQKYKAALAIADQVMTGKQADVTGGAQHYYAPRALAELHKTNPEKYPHERPEFAQGDGLPLGQSVFYP